MSLNFKQIILFFTILSISTLHLSAQSFDDLISNPEDDPGEIEDKELNRPEIQPTAKVIRVEGKKIFAKSTRKAALVILNAGTNSAFVIPKRSEESPKPRRFLASLRNERKSLYLYCARVNFGLFAKSNPARV